MTGYSLEILEATQDIWILLFQDNSLEAWVGTSWLLLMPVPFCGCQARKKFGNNVILSMTNLAYT
jgi:hypothetical protein